MVTSCVAYGCTNRAKKGHNISFHVFPTDPALCKKWISATKRKNFTPSSFSKLCSAHFNASDFVYNFGRKTLKSNTIPSIFNFPNYLLKKKSKGRSERLSKLIANNPTMCFASDQAGTSVAVEKVLPEIVLPEIALPEIALPEITLPEIVLPEIALPEIVLIPFRKRRRSVPAYMGDVTTDDLECPQKFKRIWQIATETVARQKKRIMYLQTKNCRLVKKVKSLNDLISHLKKTKNSTDCYSVLQSTCK